MAILLNLVKRGINTLRILSQKLGRECTRMLYQLKRAGIGEHDLVTMLGAICGSAQSMDRAAQSMPMAMDPYFAQESMYRAGICGSIWAIHEFCV